ncbi:unnamed protein product, partial [marine sediment metagenome]
MQETLSKQSPNLTFDLYLENSYDVHEKTTSKKFASVGDSPDDMKTEQAMQYLEKMIAKVESGEIDPSYLNRLRLNLEKFNYVAEPKFRVHRTDILYWRRAEWASKYSRDLRHSIMPPVAGPTTEFSEWPMFQSIISFYGQIVQMHREKNNDILQLFSYDVDDPQVSHMIQKLHHKIEKQLTAINDSAMVKLLEEAVMSLTSGVYYELYNGEEYNAIPRVKLSERANSGL